MKYIKNPTGFIKQRLDATFKTLPHTHILCLLTWRQLIFNTANPTECAFFFFLFFFLKETCILPVSCNSRCLPDKAPIVGAQLSVKGASPCPPLSCWANGSVSAVGRRQRRSRASLPPCAAQEHAGIHGPITPHPHFLPRAMYTSATSPLLFIYTLGSRSGRCSSSNLRCSLCVWAWRTHPPSLSKTRYCHNWPVHQVSCWKSRFCTDVRPMALSNHVHTQPGFNYTLEGKTEGLSGFYFKVPFSGKIGSRGPNSDPPHTTGKTFGFNYSDGSLLIVLLKNTSFLPASVKLRDLKLQVAVKDWWD